MEKRGETRQNQVPYWCFIRSPFYYPVIILKSMIWWFKKFYDNLLNLTFWFFLTGYWTKYEIGLQMPRSVGLVWAADLLARHGAFPGNRRNHQRKVRRSHRGEVRHDKEPPETAAHQSTIQATHQIRLSVFSGISRLLRTRSENGFIWNQRPRL